MHAAAEEAPASAMGGRGCNSRANAGFRGYVARADHVPCPRRRPSLTRVGDDLQLRGGAALSSPRPRRAPHVNGRAHAMGKIPTSGFALDNVRVKVKRPNAGIAGNCGPECISYLACLEKTSGDEVACKSARDALVKCMASAQSAVITSRHKPPVNYHLQKVWPPCPSNLLRARRRDPQSRLAQTPGTAVRSPWAPAALSRVSAFPVCTVHQRV